jgi:hypothetical protein
MTTECCGAELAADQRFCQQCGWEARAMEYQQVSCIEHGSHEGAHLTVWVEAHRVKAGNVVSFKETGDKEWLVMHCYDLIITGVNRGWGLDLPKSQRTER